MKAVLIILLLILAASNVIAEGKFRPYEIKPGVSYYSDEYSTENGIVQLGEEKNFEEVYQFYNYYEAVFDADERIVTFKAYKRGALEFSETYSYDADGSPDKKIVKGEGGVETVVDLRGVSAD